MNGVAKDCQVWDVFQDHFRMITENLSQVPSTVDGTKDQSIAWSYERMKELLEYNAQSGKRMRGIAVVSSYASIMGKNFRDTEDFKLALTMGWAIEILQASFLVADDIMDQSLTRRGNPCWYKKEEIGLQAVNDSMILESCVFKLIKNYAKHKPYYADLLDLFRDVIMYTQLGQSLDMETSEKPEVDFTYFTEERYMSIVKYKTSFYSFYLPIAITLHLTGLADGDTLKQAESILTDMGCYFQVQDDYLDIYGDSAMTGKIGTDIESNKCTWLIVKALEKTTKEQRDILQNNYGRKDGANRKAVVDVFEQIGLEGIYHRYEDETYNRLKQRINNFQHPQVPKDIFLNLLNKIYKRKK